MHQDKIFPSKIPPKNYKRDNPSTVKNKAVFTKKAKSTKPPKTKKGVIPESIIERQIFRSPFQPGIRKKKKAQALKPTPKPSKPTKFTKPQKFKRTTVENSRYTYKPGDPKQGNKLEFEKRRQNYHTRSVSSKDNRTEHIALKTDKRRVYESKQTYTKYSRFDKPSLVRYGQGYTVVDQGTVRPILTASKQDYDLQQKRHLKSKLTTKFPADQRQISYDWEATVNLWNKNRAFRVSTGHRGRFGRENSYYSSRDKEGRSIPRKDRSKEERGDLLAKFTLPKRKQIRNPNFKDKSGTNTYLK